MIVDDDIYLEVELFQYNSLHQSLQLLYFFMQRVKPTHLRMIIDQSIDELLRSIGHYTFSVLTDEGYQS